MEGGQRGDLGRLTAEFLLGVSFLLLLGLATVRLVCNLEGDNLKRMQLSFQVELCVHAERLLTYRNEKVNLFVVVFLIL